MKILYTYPDTIFGLLYNRYSGIALDNIGMARSGKVSMALMSLKYT